MDDAPERRSDKNVDLNAPQPKISCAQCHREIPTSGARATENNEYVQHFCSRECVDAWRRAARRKGHL